jgi:hypothetical protein
MNLEPLIEEIAERVAKRVLAALASAPTNAVAFTTSKAGPNPPGKSRAWALRNVKTMPGARKVGRDWVISVVDYERWARAQDAARSSRREPEAPTDIEEFADACLRGGGFRATKPAA